MADHPDEPMPIVLTATQRAAFFDALFNPPRPSDEVRKRLARIREKFGLPPLGGNSETSSGRQP
jgi:hypothetical protein